MHLEIKPFDCGQNIDTGHKEPLPKIPIRALVLGPSGCGKTQLVMNWIFLGDLSYDVCTIIAASLDQPLYRTFIDMTKNSPAFVWINGVDEMPDVDSYKKCKNVVVLDDVMAEDQSNILEYFTRGRHKK